MNQNSSNNNAVGLFESLSEEKQMQVLSFVSVTNIEDLDQAVLYMQDSNYDYNRATQAFFDKKVPGSRPSNTENSANRSTGQSSTHSFSKKPSNPNSPAHSAPVEEFKNADPNDLQTLYQRHLEKKAREEEENGGLANVGKLVKGSLVSSMKSVWSMVPTLIRGESTGGEQFFNYFSKKYPEISRQLDFKAGSFEENIQKAHKQKRPMLVYVHVESNEFANLPTKLFGNQQLVNLLKNKFILMGILANKEGYEEIKKYIDAKDCPCFAIFRVNLMDEVTLMETIPLAKENETAEAYSSVKNVESNFYFLMAEEEKVKNEVKKKMTRSHPNSLFNPENQQFLFDPYFFGYDEYANSSQGNRAQQQRNPGYNVQQQQQLEEERNLRQQQEEDFKEVERQIRQQQEQEREKQQRVEQERLRKQQEEEERRVIEQSLREERERQKQAVLQRLTQEPSEDDPNAILILFRLPDGSRVSRRFLRSDKVIILYDYIDSSDIKFEGNGEYDIIQPMPFVSLNDKEKTIGEYFEDSTQENVVVREQC